MLGQQDVMRQFWEIGDGQGCLISSIFDVDLRLYREYEIALK